MQYIRVRNWDKFQHYKDRSPPWIKMHQSLLHNYEYQCLQDASKSHLTGIWLLSSQMDNKIPADPDWIGKQIGATSKVDLKPLIDNGFIECYQDASKSIAKRSPETEAEAETETEKPKSESAIPPCPHSDLINLYHETLPELQSVLLSRWPGSSGERMLKTRWRENKQHQNLDFWRGFFRVVRTNPHWMGQNARGWRADLRWLIKRENFDKVVERWANGAAA